MAKRTSATTDTNAGELLRAARVRRDMSQRRLAEAAGVPQSTVAAIESGRRQPSVAMLHRLVQAAGFKLETRLVNATRPSEILDHKREELSKIMARYPVRAAWVFGSVARGDDQPGSDLDLLVEFAPRTPFTDSIDLAEELSEVLGCSVDVVTTKELESNDLFRRRVQAQRRPLNFAA